MRTTRWKALGRAGLVAALAVAAGCIPPWGTPPVLGEVRTITSTFTSAAVNPCAESLTVPTGVIGPIHVSASGAAGTSGATPFPSFGQGGVGGAGGVVTGDLVGVVPGEVLDICTSVQGGAGGTSSDGAGGTGGGRAQVLRGGSVVLTAGGGGGGGAARTAAGGAGGSSGQPGFDSGAIAGGTAGGGAGSGPIGLGDHAVAGSDGDGGGGGFAGGGSGGGGGGGGLNACGPASKVTTCSIDPDGNAGVVSTVTVTFQVLER